MSYPAGKFSIDDSCFPRTYWHCSKAVRGRSKSQPKKSGHFSLKSYLVILVDGPQIDYTPVFAASMKGNTDVVNVLFLAGADIHLTCTEVMFI